MKATTSQISQEIHTHSKQSNLKNVARVSLLYLGQNIKPYTSYRLGAELENSVEKHSARLSIDLASQNRTLNSAVNSIPTLHKRHALSKYKTRLNTYFDHGLPKIQIRVLIH